MKHAASAAICLALALLTYFQFPGHTWLQQDTQIYAPILEHEHDPMLLRNDPLVQQTHVDYTLYDQIALALHAVTPFTFHEVLAGEQIVARALGIWGVWLMATSLGLTMGAAWLVAMIVALGARVAGPEVLTFEFEPTPRAFALPLVMCAIGLAANRRFLGAGIAGACALLYHPPTALTFWILFALLIVTTERRSWMALAPAMAATGLLMLTARGNTVGLFERLTQFQEQVQHIRTAYVWISTWPAAVIWHYPLVFAILIAAAIRIKRIPGQLRLFSIGLPVIGLVSLPVSWLLLEKAKWAFIPQVQPLRQLLFVVLMAQFLTGAAGAIAVGQKRWAEGSAWFAAAYLLPMPMEWRPVAIAIVLGALAVAAVRYTPVLGLAAFFAIPVLAGVTNYPHLHTPELEQLSGWARGTTPRDAVFLFADAGRRLDPGIFRADAERAIYVDWKSGGQINYLRSFTEQWWFRWQETVGAGFSPRDLGRYGALGIQYVVLRPKDRLAGVAAFENGSYVVYRVP